MKKLLALLLLVPHFAFAQPQSGTTVNIGRYGGTNTTLGQKASSASIPVVLSSGQIEVDTTSGSSFGDLVKIGAFDSSLFGWGPLYTDFGSLRTVVSSSSSAPIYTQNPITLSTGSITANGQTVATSLAYGPVEVAVTGTYANINLTFEASVDGGSTYIPINAFRIDTGVFESTSGALTNTTRIWRFGADLAQFLRVRATSYTSGTMGVTLGVAGRGEDPVGGVYAAQSGTWNIGTVSTITNVVHVDDNSGSLTVDGTVTASNTTGNVAHDGVDSGNPIKIGGRARTSDFTAVSNDDRVDGLYDKNGKAIVKNGCLPENQFSGVSAADITNTTSTSVVSAGGAGVKYAVYCITVSNMSTSASTRVDLQDGTTTKWSCPASMGGGGCALCSSTPIFTGTANTALQAQCATTGTNTRVSFSGCKVP